MSRFKLTKDQVKKLGLSAVGFVFLLYVYFNFFLGPLNRSRDAMLTKIEDRESKIGASKEEMNKTARLEQVAKTATGRFTALKAINPEGAPIAWFPPRIKTFFASQKIDKAVARLESSSDFKEAESSAATPSGWMKYKWVIDLPQADYGVLGKAIAELENAEPLLAVTKLTIHTLPDQPQFQHVDIGAINVIEKK